MIGNADKADDTTAAVDAEPGRIGTTADAECHTAPRYIGGDHCGIDRTRAVLGKRRAAAAGERWGPDRLHR